DSFPSPFSTQKRLSEPLLSVSEKGDINGPHGFWGHAREVGSVTFPDDSARGRLLDDGRVVDDRTSHLRRLPTTVQQSSTTSTCPSTPKASSAAAIPANRFGSRRPIP